MLEGLARWSYKHRWQMLGIWMVALVAIIALGSTAGGDYSNNFSLPGAESQRALDLLKARFPARSGDTADIVFWADAGANDPGVRSQMQGLIAKISGLEHVDEIESPYGPGGASRISRDGKIAFATIQFDVAAADVGRPRSTGSSISAGRPTAPGSRSSSEAASSNSRSSSRPAGRRRSAFLPRSSSCSSRSGRCWRWVCRS